LRYAGGVRHRRHIFVCVQRREGGGKPACGDRGGCEVLVAVEKILIRAADPEVAVTGTQCLGPCFDGPNAVVYPDGTWHERLTADDAAALVGE
jgi:NADH:ubiquinone oxidoreductase subunit E